MSFPRKQIEPVARPAFSRESANLLIRAGEAVRDNQIRQTPPRLPPASRPVSTCKVQNKSGAALARFSAVALRAHIIAEADNAPEFKRQCTFEVYKPQAADVANDPQKIAIVVEPLADDKIGTAVISGAVACRVNVTNTAHRFATLTSGQEYLTSGETGDAQILSELSSTGTQWVVVRIPAFAGGDTSFSDSVTITPGDPTSDAPIIVSRPTTIQNIDTPAANYVAIFVDVAGNLHTIDEYGHCKCYLPAECGDSTLLGSELKVWLKMEEASTPYENSAGSPNFEAGPGAGNNPASVDGKIGNGLQFTVDGGTPDDNVASSSNFDMGSNNDDWAIAFWMKIDAVDGTFDVNLFDGIAGLDIDLDAASSELQCNFGTGTAAAVSVSADSAWHFYYIEFDGTADEISVSKDNGSLDTQSMTEPTRSPGTLSIASIVAGSWDVSLDEVMIWVGKTLSSDERSTLYNDGNGKPNLGCGTIGPEWFDTQSTTGTTTGFTAGSGTAAKDDSTYTGGTGSKAYTVGDVVLALKTLGILEA